MINLNIIKNNGLLKNLLAAIALILFVSCFAGCRDDDKFTDSIFVDDGELDPSSKTYAFDTWLEENYRKPYNLRFQYKMVDVASDVDYNLVPTELSKSEKIAILVKYLWFDAYNKVAGDEFLKLNGPRIIHLIGSPAYNPALGTMVLGTAEGGIKVTLYRCNDLDPAKVEEMNEFYFKTMHHEFAHILHQKKTYPKKFETFSAGYYDPSGWQHRTDSEAASLGFVSPYGSSQPREDFVEIIANYIVKTDKEWNAILDLASKPGVNESGTVIDDPLNGKQIILDKLEIAKDWLKTAWKIDLDELKKEVQERQTHINDVLSQSYW